MAAAIGLRIYQTTITKDGEIAPVKFISGDEGSDPHIFIHRYFTDPAVIISDSDAQRSWYVTELHYADQSKRNFYGVFSYGIYGFESTIVDTKTKAAVHERQVHEAEQIPLTFQVWAPENSNWAYLSFQSFQARSCVTVVQNAIARSFEKAHPGYRLRFQKLSPSDGRLKSLFDSNVKEVRLMKRRAPSDKTDAVSGRVKLDEANIQLVIQAPRNRILGTLSDIREKLTSKPTLDGGSVITFQGNDYEQAAAQVLVGRKRRLVGLVGYNNDAGVIDITNDVALGKGGHPTPKSVFDESNDILVNLHEILKKKR
ncbi:hypothetical protein FS764_19295 [Agrobacterium vitis]|uniref:hypothetical protein n=1 Tax=Agrobacterium vitis TaxID=373 RepID=UPI001F2790FC|nr:hypothetical protein [Agrobacterium vitis]MCF1469051.1 hypothetical protein [Agrobacterium vitis]